MNTTTKKFHSSFTANLYSALLVVLSVVVLVLTCPLKRVLQNDFTVRSTSPAKSNQTNNKLATASDYYTSVHGCAIEQQVISTKVISTKQERIPTFTDLSNILTQAGFGLNYFSRGLSYRNRIPSTFIICSLPQFLQHLRLLI